MSNDDRSLTEIVFAHRPPREPAPTDASPPPAVPTSLTPEELVARWESLAPELQVVIDGLIEEGHLETAGIFFMSEHEVRAAWSEKSPSWEIVPGSFMPWDPCPVGEHVLVHAPGRDTWVEGVIEEPFYLYVKKRAPHRETCPNCMCQKKMDDPGSFAAAWAVRLLDAQGAPGTVQWTPYRALHLPWQIRRMP